MSGFDIFNKEPVATTEEVESQEGKKYPAWVTTAGTPNKVAKLTKLYDVTEALFEEAKEKIKTGDYETATEVQISQTDITVAFGKDKSKRSFLKSYSDITDLMDDYNDELRKLIERNKAKTKNTFRPTKDQLADEVKKQKAVNATKTKEELDMLINSELLVTQADALADVAKLKVENDGLHTKVAELELANNKLQDEIKNLQQRLFQSKKGHNLTVKK